MNVPDIPEAPSRQAAHAIALRCGDAWLHALPERALWWPAARTLLVADLHLGKGAAFRAAGLAVPRGSSAGDLGRLAALIAQHRAERLIVLGDFWHHASGRSAALLAQLAAFRAAHGQLNWLLVRGNHDVQAGDPPPSLGIQTVSDPWRLAPGLLARHAPLPWDMPVAEDVTLCGHLHPAVTLATRTDRLRVPCYLWLPGRQLVLPAFGALTGHASLDRAHCEAHGAHLGLVTPGRVVWSPPLGPLGA